MTNHIHLIYSCENRNPQQVLQDFKKYTAKSIINEIKNNCKESRKIWMLDLMKKEGSKINQFYQFWQHNNHPVEL